jgi:predicted patatin/cPLA2 family phospholipase
MGDVILYVSGGAMSAVFAAGALEALYEANIHTHLDAIYGVSAGALNAAFFVTGQARRGHEWYTRIVPKENLIRHQSIVSTVRKINPFDLERANEVLVNRRLLDVDLLVASSIPVFAKVLHAKKKEVAYIDIRRADAVRVLCASAAVMPFVSGPVTIDNESYVDGALAEPLGIDRLRALHPNAKIILVANSRFEDYSFRKVAQWALMHACNSEYASLFWNGYTRAQQELAHARSDEQCFVIEPKTNYPVLGITTDETVLEHGYRMGHEVAAERLDALREFIGERPEHKERTVPLQVA